MEQAPIHPGVVEWSCENPGMYLKESPDGKYVTVISFARTFFSPHGRGHAAFLFLDPHGDGQHPDRPNVCVTDNERLARYLTENFIASFPQFKGLPSLANFHFKDGQNFSTAGDPRSSYSERFQSHLGEVTLTWSHLGEPFLVQLPREKSVTGKHAMFSLFISAAEARAVIDGRPVAGRPFCRTYHGKALSTAFLAFAETWVRP
jgi:hypothetical protein